MMISEFEEWLRSRTNGWRTRSMVDRYGADMADQRARDAKRRMGDMY
jgi:hypothetical protein